MERKSLYYAYRIHLNQPIRPSSEINRKRFFAQKRYVDDMIIQSLTAKTTRFIANEITQLNNLRASNRAKDWQIQNLRLVTNLKSILDSFNLPQFDNEIFNGEFIFNSVCLYTDYVFNPYDRSIHIYCFSRPKNDQLDVIKGFYKHSPRNNFKNFNTIVLWNLYDGIVISEHINSISGIPGQEVNRIVRAL